MNDQSPIRIVKTYAHTFDAPAEKVFPQLCPVLEYDWIDGWECEMIYSDSGVAELGCIFTSEFMSEGTSIWVISRYEPSRTIEFTVFEAGMRMMKMDVAMSDNGGQTTKVKWTHTFTALNEAGRRSMSGVTDQIYQNRMGGLAVMLEHYLKTGEKLILGNTH